MDESECVCDKDREAEFSHGMCVYEIQTMLKRKHD